MNFKQGRHIVRAYYFIIIPYCYTMQDQEDSGQAIFRTPVRFATYNITLYGNVVIFSDSFFTIPILILVVVLLSRARSPVCIRFVFCTTIHHRHRIREILLSQSPHPICISAWLSCTVLVCAHYNQFIWDNFQQINSQDEFDLIRLNEEEEEQECTNRGCNRSTAALFSGNDYRVN